MDPLFKNTTKYTNKTYQKFIDFHNKKFDLSSTLYTIVMFILIIYCFIYSISQKTFLLSLVFFIAFILYSILKIYVPTQKYKKTKNKYQDKPSYYTYIFYKMYFTISDKPIYYFKLHRIFETTDCFYLYIDDDTAFSVSKSGFKLGTAEEFSKFIQKKCFFKYRKQK